MYWKTGAIFCLKLWHVHCLQVKKAVNSKVPSELANLPHLQTVLPSDMNTVCNKAEKY